MTLGKPTAALRPLAFDENLRRLEARWQVFVGERIQAILAHVRVKTFHGTERAVHVAGTVEGPSLKSGSDLAFGSPSFAWTNRLSSERQGVPSPGALVGPLSLCSASHRT